MEKDTLKVLDAASESFEKQAATELEAAQGVVNRESQAPNKRSLDEALSEVEREYNVRERCFPGWVKDGRLTRVDAKDRLERLAAALYFLQRLLDSGAPF